MLNGYGQISWNGQGTYTVTFTATDSEGAAATPQTLTIRVTR